MEKIMMNHQNLVLPYFETDLFAVSFGSYPLLAGADTWCEATKLFAQVAERVGGSARQNPQYFWGYGSPKISAFIQSF